MLWRKNHKDREAEALAALVADAQHLDYGGGFARELQRQEGKPQEERVPPQLPRRTLPAESYYKP